MIGRQTKGRSFRGLLNYLETKEKASRIGGNMSGRNARELAAEFKVSRQLNPEVERAVYHASLSLPQHERLDDDVWNEIADKYLVGMNFTDNQYVVYRHNDTAFDHIHIAICRIKLSDGSCVHDGWDYLRSQRVIRQLERDYGLEQTPSSYERTTARKSPSRGQKQRMERERADYECGERDVPPELPVKTQLQEIIDSAAIDQPTMTLLVARLQLQGVGVHHGMTRTGKSKGISYKFQGQAFSGSQLGAAYSFSGLQKHLGVDYDAVRDLPALQTATVACMVPLHEVSQVEFKQPDYQSDVTSNLVSQEKSEISTAKQPQQGYAAVIAPTIRLLIQHQGESDRIVGSHYELYRAGSHMELRRTTGEEIARIPLTVDEEPQDFGLTLEDVQRLERLRLWLEEDRKNQQQQEDSRERAQSRSWDLER